jgi:TetR/AcrR family transcriptional repressor of nem operon
MSESRLKQIQREKLLDQGVNLMMTQSYPATGVKEILDSVQMSQGSSYHYFENKETFAVEVIKYYITPFLTQLQTHLDDPRYDALSSMTFYFDELIRLSRQENFKSSCLLGNLMGEMGASSDLCRLALKSAVDDYRDLLEKGLNLAQKQGTVRADKTAKRMADLLVDSWQGALLRMKIEQSSTPLARCCDDLLHDYFKVNLRR